MDDGKLIFEGEYYNNDWWNGKVYDFKGKFEYEIKMKNNV